MGNAWITFRLLYFYHECIKWEVPGLHYSYCTFTMNALNGKCLDYIMVTVLITINALNGKCLCNRIDYKLVIMEKHQNQFQIDMVLQLVQVTREIIRDFYLVNNAHALQTRY